MKGQIFRKIKELKNKNESENSIKTSNNFNQLENTNKRRIYNPNGKQYNENSKENNSSNSPSKRGKMGKLEYAIEPRNILLIPSNVNINKNNLKICEKELLPKEKNYFISETNFQLIKNALNEKEKNINNLKTLLEKKNKEILLLEKENKKLEDANNELILQIQKNDIYFDKMYQLLKYVFNYYDSFNDPQIKGFIKEQNLGSLINKSNITQENKNQNNDNNTNNKNENGKIVSVLFDTNNDEILKELEKYKKMYNDIRKQLNHMTNMKLNDKNNQDELSKQLIEYQKKINELNSENQNYIKENTYLKLLCKNIFLEKKIVEIDDNEQVIKELKNENEILKKKIDSLVKEINQLKLDNNKINELNKILNDKNLKLNEELKNLNSIYSKTIKSSKSNWKKLKIEKTEKLFYNKENNDIYYKNKLNLGALQENAEQIDNIDLLMLLYNKSKELEPYLDNK